MDKTTMSVPEGLSARSTLPSPFWGGVGLFVSWLCRNSAIFFGLMIPGYLTMVVAYEPPAYEHGSVLPAILLAPLMALSSRSSPRCSLWCWAGRSRCSYIQRSC